MKLSNKCFTHYRLLTHIYVMRVGQIMADSFWTLRTTRNQMRLFTLRKNTLWIYSAKRWLYIVQAPASWMYSNTGLIERITLTIPGPFSRGILVCVGVVYISTFMLTLLILETDLSGFGGQCHACWCSGSLSRPDISRHGIGNIG